VSSVRQAAGGGRWVDVDPERLPAWLNRFAVNHGGYRVTGVSSPSAPQASPTELAASAPQASPKGDTALRLLAGDGTTLGLWPPPGAPLSNDVEEFVVQAQRERRIGLLLARQASVAVGIAEGPHIISSKVDTYYVQSRTAAGGWSQQRYARRRANQARAAAEGAADQAVRLLAGELDHLAALVTGGDRRTVEAVLADPRLAAARLLVAERFLPVGEPRRKTLDEAVALARLVRILVRDPVVSGATDNAG
jgi:Actinobacteria/chloroflexi VLRF1 release factor